jgi:hypothetical protein
MSGIREKLKRKLSMHDKNRMSAYLACTLLISDLLTPT